MEGCTVGPLVDQAHHVPGLAHVGRQQAGEHGLGHGFGAHLACAGRRQIVRQQVGQRVDAGRNLFRQVVARRRREVARRRRLAHPEPGVGKEEQEVGPAGGFAGRRTGSGGLRNLERRQAARGGRQAVWRRFERPLEDGDVAQCVDEFDAYVGSDIGTTGLHETRLAIELDAEVDSRVALVRESQRKRRITQRLVQRGRCSRCEVWRRLLRLGPERRQLPGQEEVQVEQQVPRRCLHRAALGAQRVGVGSGDVERTWGLRAGRFGRLRKHSLVPGGLQGVSIIQVHARPGRPALHRHIDQRLPRPHHLDLEQHHARVERAQAARFFLRCFAATLRRGRGRVGRRALIDLALAHRHAAHEQAAPVPVVLRVEGREHRQPFLAAHKRRARVFIGGRSHLPPLAQLGAQHERELVPQRRVRGVGQGLAGRTGRLRDQPADHERNPVAGRIDLAIWQARDLADERTADQVVAHLSGLVELEFGHWQRYRQRQRQPRRYRQRYGHTNRPKPGRQRRSSGLQQRLALQAEHLGGWPLQPARRLAFGRRPRAAPGFFHHRVLRQPGRIGLQRGQQFVHELVVGKAQDLRLRQHLVGLHIATRISPERLRRGPGERMVVVHPGLTRCCPRRACRKR